jgi:hypothetical protein
MIDKYIMEEECPTSRGNLPQDILDFLYYFCPTFGIVSCYLYNLSCVLQVDERTASGYNFAFVSRHFHCIIVKEMKDYSVSIMRVQPNHNDREVKNRAARMANY